MAEWTFITNHAVVLSFLHQHGTITAREVAIQVGITERAVRKIINDLEINGYIMKNREGRRVSYSVKKNRPLRHQSQRDKSVGDLLKLLGLNKSNPSKRNGTGPKG